MVQGLIKVAVDNARLQEKQVQQERKELKMELYREREMRESLERQLTSELHSRGAYTQKMCLCVICLFYFILAFLIGGTNIQMSS